MPITRAPYHATAPMIRWKAEADGFPTDQFPPGLGGIPLSVGSCIAGVSEFTEAWAYTDQTDMRATWPVSVDCGTGTQVGGFGGATLVMVDVTFGCGIGAGAGHLLHQATFPVPLGSHKVIAVISVVPSPGFLNMGISIAGHVFNVNGSATVSYCTGPGVSAIPIEIGAFDLEFGMGEHSITVESIDIFSATAADETPGEEGTSPDGEGWCELHFGYPLGQARAWGAPAPTSQRMRYPAASDAWTDPEHQFLEGIVRHIPANDMVTDYGLQSSWNSPCGWQRFLDWARRGNTFEFYPDQDDALTFYTCYLDEPKGRPTLNRIFREIALRIRTADNAPFEGY